MTVSELVVFVAHPSALCFSVRSWETLSGLAPSTESLFEVIINQISFMLVTLSLCQEKPIHIKSDLSHALSLRSVP